MYYKYTLLINTWSILPETKDIPWMKTFETLYNFLLK